jgi:uridylate kinase
MAKNGVDGVYDKDPKKHDDATMYEALTQEDLLVKKLGVMDQTAASICHENKIDVIVFNLNTTGNMKKAVLEEPIGTKVSWEG